VAAFRLLLGAFGVAVLFFSASYIATGERRYLRGALWLLAAALISGVLFFSILLVSRFV
jgi:hypothetical protein